jgi:hypothetical protein
MFGVLVVVLGRDDHSFFSRCENPVALGAAYSTAAAVSGQ